MGADCKDAMMTYAPPGADAPPPHADVWDAQRLASLLADVGETGLRDILRLFLADLPHLQAQLARAIAGNDEAAALLDSAEALGLAALASLVRGLRADPLAVGNRDLLAEEAARIRFVPSLKQAS